jgi:hypothetical protein
MGTLNNKPTIDARAAVKTPIQTIIADKCLQHGTDKANLLSIKLLHKYLKKYPIRLSPPMICITAMFRPWLPLKTIEETFHPGYLPHLIQELPIRKTLVQ